MKKKDLIFTLGLTLLTGVLWIAGEVVMGLWIAAPPIVHILWMVGIVAATLVISVWHSMLKDESDRVDPKLEKYERKTKKRKKK